MARNKSRIVLAVAAVMVLAVTGTTFAGGATRASDALWAHGILYDTIITPATFVAPPEHSTDIIYSFMMSGLGGQRGVAEAAPGNPDYNGGRWNVYMAVFTPAGVAAHDTDNDGIVDFELTSADQVLEHETLGHLDIFPANFYFECPLLPRRR